MRPVPALGICFATILSACSAPRTRAVVASEPLVSSFEIIERTPAEQLDEILPWRRVVAEVEGAEWTVLDAVSPLADPLEQRNLDSHFGPVDPGLMLLLDLGAGEAPYDDAVRPIHGVEHGRPGFSGSVAVVSLRRWIAPRTALVGSAAFSRQQEVSWLDGIDDSRFAWVVAGLSFTW